MDTTRLRVRPPCTRNQRPAASLDTVRHEQRSSEKRGHIYRTGLLTEGTHEAHRFPCCFNETLSLAEHAATYKGRPLLGAPRTEPYVRHSRIRLPPWVFDAEALSRPGMGYPGFGQPAVRQPVHVGPRRSILLAAPAQGAPPEFDDVAAERRRGPVVGGYGVVGEEAPHHCPQPTALLGNVLVP